MLQLFTSAKPFDDAHSYTGAQLAGMSFEAFLQAKADGNKAVTGEHGFRYCGKFTNLANQYRIGIRKLRIQARVQYGLNKDSHTIKQWQETYHRAYPGVKKYWKAAIEIARTRGYAETRAGRRFYITDWNIKDRVWASESSAINFPIQGTGADMKELAIAMMTLKFPMFVFAFDLHDGIFFWLDVQYDDALILEAREMLNNLPYESAWGWVPSVPIPWDAAAGLNWGEMEEL